MLNILRKFIFGKPSVIMAHDFFGKIEFLGNIKPRQDDYWEGEYFLASTETIISVLITAGIEGPAQEQVEFFKHISSNLDELFLKCWPIFEPDFEQWTGKQFSGNWRDDFELTGLTIPKDANINNCWNVCYFVDSANHYFTAQFEQDQPKYNEIDG